MTVLSRHVRERIHDRRISLIEVLVVAGVQVDFAAGFDSDCAVSIQLDLVLPLIAIGKHVRPEQKHGIVEAGLG